MWRRGTVVTVLECDARVQREYAYRGVPPRSVSGRGGTGFDPAIARANQIHPDGLVYFTDGIDGETHGLFGAITSVPLIGTSTPTHSEAHVA